MDYRGRQKHLLEILTDQKLDSLMITHPPNVRYLCGFTGSAAALLIGSEGRLFFTDGRYTQQAKEQVEGARVVISRTNPVSAAAQWLGRKRARHVLGVEAEHTTLAARATLSRTLPRTVRIRPVSNLVQGQRMMKDAAEL